MNRPAKKALGSCPSIDGSTFYDAAGKYYKITCGMDYQGNDIVEKDNIATLEQCINACDATDGCIGVGFAHDGYYGSNPGCYLESAQSSNAVNSTTDLSYVVDSAYLVSGSMKKRDVASVNVKVVSTSSSSASSSSATLSSSQTSTASAFSTSVVSPTSSTLSSISVRSSTSVTASVSASVSSSKSSSPSSSMTSSSTSSSASSSATATADNTTTALLAVDTLGHFYFPVLCSFEGAQQAKVFLVKDPTADLSFTADPELRFILTGGVVSQCNPLALTSKSLKALA